MGASYVPLVIPFVDLFPYPLSAMFAHARCHTPQGLLSSVAPELTPSYAETLRDPSKVLSAHLWYVLR